MKARNKSHRGFVSQSVLWASSSMLALSAVAPATALAQEAEDAAEAEQEENSDDTIVVSGIRSRIETSQNIKRNADTFVDAVTAEDIGALPDRSVNETLQRIPGVTITRFQGRDDPDHFSIEGANVVIRGLNYVRSEFNGRDAFSVNTGRSLGFNDISPELIGSVQVFKNATADMIEGGISGTVNLVTRKPLDQRRLIVAGTLEGNYGDLREDLQPQYSLLLSNAFDTDIGTFGLQASYSRSKLNSRAFGSHVTDYRDRTDLGPDLVWVPRGIAARTQEFERDRSTYNGVLQWEATDGSALVTLEYVRAEAIQAWGERVLEVDLGSGGDPQPAAGQPDFGYNSDGVLTSGFLGDPAPSLYSFPNRQRELENSNEDISLNIRLQPTDRLGITFDVQRATATTDDLDFSIFGASNGLRPLIGGFNAGAPDIQLLNGDGSASDQLSNPASYYYRAAMDHIEDSDGFENAFRADVDYEVGDGFLRKLYAGGRYSEREQTRRYTVYNWFVLSESWAGGVTPFTTDGPLAVEAFNFPNFQRGNNPAPVETGLYLSGDLLEGYRNGTLIDAAIGTQQGGFGWVPLDQRGGVIPGTPYLPSEINESAEETFAAYTRADFGIYDIFGQGTELRGNIGVRYVRTDFSTVGSIRTPELGDLYGFVSGSSGPARTRADACAGPFTGSAPFFCDASFDSRVAEFEAFADGALLPGGNSNSYDYFLPSLNLNLLLADDLIIRFAASRAISRPDFGVNAFGGNIFANDLNNLPDAERASAPLFVLPTATGQQEAIKATNFDFGVEWYFAPQSAVTFNAFYKKLDDILASGSLVQTVTNSSGVSTDVLVVGQVNIGDGSVKGFEIGYQQFYDFLPGFLSGLGLEGNYTFVDPSEFPNQVSEPRFAGLTLPLDQLSRHTFNIAALYEKYGLSARLAYNWRSRFLLTPRDVINPFSPIWHAPTGQADLSVFYNVTDQVKVGFQVANLFDEVTVTEQQTARVVGGDNEAGPLAPRSYFRNDRRLSFGVRFNF